MLFHILYNFHIIFFRLILLNKLLEDGNVLYRKSRLREAAHRYQYALKKFPTEDQGEHNKAFHQLKINFLLNYSRCKRKLNVSIKGNIYILVIIILEVWSLHIN